ncbi:MAG: hypothetical protein ACOVKS_02070, partial [Aquimonas sp.]
MKLSSAPLPCIASVIAQHSEELAFTWQRRQRAWSAPNHRAAHLHEIDSQLDAHLDGLHIAGREALAPAVQRFKRWGTDEEAFAATAVVGLCASVAVDEATRAELDSLLITHPRSVRGAAAA